MVAVIGVFLLFITGFGCGTCERSTQCYDSCVSKIPDKPQLCNDSCLQLLNIYSANNITTNISITLPPTPDEPVLHSSGYFKFTLEWSSYSETKYNASPVVYVLEVTRHENITDPFIILPFIEKYHTTSDTTFTIPEDFVTKTNYSFRLAAVALQGTSNFSSPSPLYTTNSSCERTENFYNDSLFNPCPVFNVRVSFTVSPIPFERPNISTVIHWDLPHDVHTHLEENYIRLDITRLDNQPEHCHDYGLLNHFADTYPEHPATSYDEPLPLENAFYFGCGYEVKLFLEDVVTFTALTTFNIPHCIHGFCGCDRPPRSPLETSEYIDIHVKEQSGINKTTINVTWSIQAWPNKQPAFFKLILLECVHGLCPSTVGQRREIVVADSRGVKTNYSFAFKNRTKDEKHYIIVAAFDSSGCHLSPTEGEEFNARIIPTTPPKTVPTTVPTTVPSTAPTTVPSTAPTTVPSTAPTTVPSTVRSTTGGVILTETGGMSSGKVAAITVPIVLLLLIGLLLIGFLWYYRRHKMPSRLHRAPTGLQRLADHLDDRNNYRRNLSDVPSSPYANDYDRFNLVVNLPSKSEGGLELNPAYVEQRIQEAVETGEADEFEFGFHRLELKRVLGKGAFGKVFLAEAYGMGDTDQDTSLVAVKVLNDKATEDEIEDFKMEINFMKTIGLHENVVTMLGCCTLYPPLCLLVEYVPHGDLLHYLRDLRKTFEKQNRILQGEDITCLKNNEKSSCSQSQTEGSETTIPGSNSHRPLVPSVSDTAVSAANQLQKTSQQPNTQPSPYKHNIQRQLLRQCKSEGKQLTISNWIKKYEKFLEPTEKGKFNRSHSSGSLKGQKAVNTARRYSEDPKAHYTAWGTTDESNNTQTTLVLDSKEVSKAQTASPTRSSSLDGALDASELQSFAYQIANGMAYLSGKGIVHRDLAARNILVGDEKVLKISDFGLSREGIYVKRSTGKIPLRWLSVEAMRDRIYSTASDIWAFGIVLWEICTLGGFPYPTISDMNLLNFLLEGSRMEKPNNCTDEIYQIMLACWSRECDDRPSFQTLSEELFDMQKEEQPYVNVDPSQAFILPPTAGRDTIGNLIAFSDGTFSGETADHDELEMEELPKKSSPGKMSQQSELPLSRDEENAGYESSDGSEDMSASFENTADNEIGPSLQKEKPVDIDDTNIMWVV